MRTRAVGSTLAITVLAMSCLLATIQSATAAATFTVRTFKAGNGHGQITSDLPGIACGTTCEWDFDTPVTLTATPSANSTFVGWEGDCGGSGTCLVTDTSSVTARFVLINRPDAWIKLCGLSTWCTINGLPHPWKGKNIYNATGRRQKVSVRMEDGEGVRFWMTFENDGVVDDTYTIQGCKGTRRFKVNKVTIGFTKGPKAGTQLINEQFKNGTATFDVGPASSGQKIELTLNIIAPTTAEGVTYRCPVTVTSQNDPTMTDTILARMTTY